MKIEEGTVRYRADVVCAFRAIISETRTLSTCNKQHSNLASAEFLFACRVGFGACRIGKLNNVGRERIGKCRCCGLLRQHLLHAFNARKIKRCDLFEQPLLRGCIERLPEFEDVRLVVGFKKCFGVFKRHFMSPVGLIGIME